MTDPVRKKVLEKLLNGDYTCKKEFTLSMFSGKWKINIIYHLGHEGSYYFYELQKLLPHASHKEISEKLKELVEDGLINRQPEDGPRIKVAYSLTSLGRSLLPIIDEMYDWGEKRLQELQMKDINFGLGESKK
ncbi:HxlR family transcriptional regulator [Oenococcus oeni IOEB_C23]|uniref:winged helix-turn-helix transcriptional regulator n=1 Tax=Oenococcus oeni TaxID=1247 RepID=UPI00050F05B4|nr:helix-turn-helix domain-containing protein [Oenococcus oeni]KGH64591.1 HxlR family transcriptional regulator [Oenococcus oeni IOEB_C23]MDN6968361.1 helix-turn-helix transcriptional regulator [Oenococcus sp. UCMA 17063]